MVLAKSEEARGGAQSNQWSHSRKSECGHFGPGQEVPPDEARRARDGAQAAERNDREHRPTAMPMHPNQASTPQHAGVAHLARRQKPWWSRNGSCRKSRWQRLTTRGSGRVQHRERRQRDPYLSRHYSGPTKAGTHQNEDASKPLFQAAAQRPPRPRQPLAYGGPLHPVWGLPIQSGSPPHHVRTSAPDAPRLRGESQIAPHRTRYLHAGAGS
mmetsp:Transcript_2166/g.5096  ORF Transcript_2166/g.5096 Transcript_2166/m.5096 type:complete len:213 (-) Transcript_2166:754-1392(-)